MKGKVVVVLVLMGVLLALPSLVSAGDQGIMQCWFAKYSDGMNPPQDTKVQVDVIGGVLQVPPPSGSYSGCGLTLREYPAATIQLVSCDPGWEFLGGYLDCRSLPILKSGKVASVAIRVIPPTTVPVVVQPRVKAQPTQAVLVQQLTMLSTPTQVPTSRPIPTFTPVLQPYPLATSTAIVVSDLNYAVEGWSSGQETSGGGRGWMYALGAGFFGIALVLALILVRQNIVLQQNTPEAGGGQHEELPVRPSRRKPVSLPEDGDVLGEQKGDGKTEDPIIVAEVGADGKISVVGDQVRRPKQTVSSFGNGMVQPQFPGARRRVVPPPKED